MASLFSHAVAAVSIGTCFYQPREAKTALVLGAICSVIPDLDVIGFRFGIHYGDFWGHRGFTHSLVFAATLAGALSFIASKGERLRLAIYLFIATASHGVLDAMTNGGLGVAFFSPFDNTRYFFPWTPIRVSPIGAGRFFSSRGIAVLQSEMLVIWIAAAAVIFAALLRRSGMSKQHSS